MQHFITFLVDNWKIILEIFILILSVVVFIFRKPTNKVISGLFENLYSWCLEAVIFSEKNICYGANKLDFALNYVRRLVSLNYPDLDFERYSSFVKEIIEKILITPTKKGGLGREKEIIKKGE